MGVRVSAYVKMPVIGPAFPSRLDSIISRWQIYAFVIHSLSTFRKSSQIWSGDAGWSSSFRSIGKIKKAWKTTLKQPGAWLNTIPAHSLCSAWASLKCKALALFWWDFCLHAGSTMSYWSVFDTQGLAQCFVQGLQTTYSFKCNKHCLGRRRWQSKWLTFMAFVFLMLQTFA